MPRTPRQDYPGAWHHVINRGLARRPLFEDRVDIRFFLSRIAREVRRKRLEVHAWSILTTHFHMLVRSPTGELSEAMRRAQNEYSRFFNRRHRRDGTLVRGRFMSKPVDSLAYRRALVRYIDGNAVQARLASTPWSYPYGSAAQYVHRQGPGWLERSWVESEIRLSSSGALSGRAGYIATFGEPGGAGLQRLVDLRIRAHRVGGDPLDDLIGAAPDRVREWMQCKAKLADGVAVGIAVCDPASIESVISKGRATQGTWTVAPNLRERDAWSLVAVGLMRSLAMLPWKEIARMTEGTISSCQRRFEVHAALMEDESAYGGRVAGLVSEALRLCYHGR